MTNAASPYGLVTLKLVLEGVGFGSKVAECHSRLTPADVEVCREVIGRKASAFWVDGSARTTVIEVSRVMSVLPDPRSALSPCISKENQLNG